MKMKNVSEERTFQVLVEYSPEQVSDMFPQNMSMFKDKESSRCTGAVSFFL